MPRGGLLVRHVPPRHHRLTLGAQVKLKESQLKTSEQQLKARFEDIQKVSRMDPVVPRARRQHGRALVAPLSGAEHPPLCTLLRGHNLTP